MLIGEMEHLTCKVDNQGRITLPVEWRKAHHIEAGNDISVILAEDRLEVQTVDQSLDDARRIAAKYRGGKPAVEMLHEARTREAKQERAEEQAHG